MLTMLSKWSELWLESVIALTGKVSTVETYRFAIAPYVEFLGAETCAISRDDVSRYLASLSGIAENTYNLRRTAMRLMHKFLLIEEILPYDPTIKLQPARTKRLLPSVLSQVEIERLLAAARQFPTDPTPFAYAGLVRRVALLELLYASGLRISEALAVTVDRYQQGRGMLMVLGKGDKERLAPVHKKALEAVDDWLLVRQGLPSRNSIWLFHSARDGKSHLTRMQAFAEIKALAESAGIRPEKLSPHKLRHAFATHLLSNGVDIRTLQEMLGHADIATTEIYTHVDLRRSADMLRDLHPLNDKTPVHGD